nr:hypothetical protein CFP56_64904 [Quercus suber]
MHVDRGRVQSRSLESMLEIGRETSREAPGVLIPYNAIHIHSCSWRWLATSPTRRRDRGDGGSRPARSPLALLDMILPAGLTTTALSASSGVHISCIPDLT